MDFLFRRKNCLQQRGDLGLIPGSGRSVRRGMVYLASLPDESYRQLNCLKAWVHKGKRTGHDWATNIHAEKQKPIYIGLPKSHLEFSVRYGKPEQTFCLTQYLLQNFNKLYFGRRESCMMLSICIITIIVCKLLHLLSCFSHNMVRASFIIPIWVKTKFSMRDTALTHNKIDNFGTLNSNSGLLSLKAVLFFQEPKARQSYCQESTVKAVAGFLKCVHLPSCYWSTLPLYWVQMGTRALSMAGEEMTC